MSLRAFHHHVDDVDLYTAIVTGATLLEWAEGVSSCGDDDPDRAAAVQAMYDQFETPPSVHGFIAAIPTTAVVFIDEDAGPPGYGVLLIDPETRPALVTGIHDLTALEHGALVADAVDKLCQRPLPVTIVALDITEVTYTAAAIDDAELSIDLADPTTYVSDGSGDHAPGAAPDLD